jgi:hypothetical protein
MARLFIGSKEQNFISDINRELVKDVIGQYIVYFPISMLQTRVHEVYEEAIEKIFENPIKLDVLAGQPTRSAKWNAFGMEGDTSIELYIQTRDLVDKDISVTSGDFFVYGEEVYEILNAIDVDNIYGQVEYDKAVKVTGKLSRVGQFDIETFKELLFKSKNFNDSQVQNKFVQQRGLPETEEGPTADKREIREHLGNDMAEIALGDGPRKIDTEKKDDLGNPKDEAFEEQGNNGFYNE